MEYRIIDKGTGKWLLQQRDKYDKNWRFVSESKSVIVCFYNLLKKLNLLKNHLKVYRVRIEEQ